MSNNNVGAGILVMGELSRIENNASREIGAATASATAAGYRAATAELILARITFAAKSQIHWLRARNNAHKLTEDQLIAALKAENPSHPLADRDAVDVIFEENRQSSLYDLKTIKRTYPDGLIPDGSMPDVDGHPGVVDGEPGLPSPVKEYDDILKHFKLDEDTVKDPEVMQDCVSRQEKYVQDMKDQLSADDKKGFFTSLNKEKRRDLERGSTGSIDWLNQLNTLLEIAVGHKDAVAQAEQKKVREEAARGRLKGMGLV